MIPIQLDIAALMDEFPQINEKDLSSTVLAASLAELNRQIKTKAIDKLDSSKAEFLKNIHVEMASAHFGWVELTGKFPNAVESGADAFDMKRGLLASAKAKTAQDGSKYIDVPFKHGTPGANKNNFATIMPKDVYKIAKKLGTRERLDINEVGNPHDIPKSRAAIMDKSGGGLGIQTPICYPCRYAKDSNFWTEPRQIHDIQKN